MKKLFSLCILATVLLGCGKRDFLCKCKINGLDYDTIIVNTTQVNAAKQCSNQAKAIGKKQGNYTYKCNVN